MKKSNIFVGMAAVAVLGILPACSSDYLDTAPETQVSNNDIGASATAAQLTVNGIAQAMQMQYQETDYNQYNGESYINTVFGEGLGQDCQVGLTQAMFNNEAVCGGIQWSRENSLINGLPWMYCYNVISRANDLIRSLISHAEDFNGTEEEYNFYLAQALTFRAHGYTKLMQFYGARWEESNNGELICAVLRNETVGVEKNSAPLATQKQIMDQIYGDLDRAIDLFSKSSVERPNKISPDISVARGIYARAALLKNDWEKAETMAHDARQNYTIIDNDTYLSGFIYDNDGLMWTQSSFDEDIYYWSWGCHYTPNGLYVNNWGVGSLSIDWDFYKTLDPNDIRRQCFLTPDKVDVLVAANKAWNPGKITEPDWWDPVLVNESNHVDLHAGPFTRKQAQDDPNNPDDKWGLYNIALRYSKYYLENLFKGNAADMVNNGIDGGFYSYYKLVNSGGMTLPGNTQGQLCVISFGAHYKFWSIPPYGTNCYPFMRAAEMCLIEAEAAYHNNHPSVAISCLNEINGKRIPGYTCTKSGEELLEEIRHSRRAELWGEGFNWSDFKRWKLPIVRREWKAKDPTSGNWMAEYGYTTPVDVNGGWRLIIPKAESDYNQGFTRDQVPVTDNPAILVKPEEPKLEE